ASQRPPRTLNENRPGREPRPPAPLVGADRRRGGGEAPGRGGGGGGGGGGVRPIGDWSTSITLSRCSAPARDRNRPGEVRDRYTAAIRALSRTSLTRGDLPDPDTPA